MLGIPRRAQWPAEGSLVLRPAVSRGSGGLFCAPALWPLTVSRSLLTAGFQGQVAAHLSASLRLRPFWVTFGFLVLGVRGFSQIWEVWPYASRPSVVESLLCFGPSCAASSGALGVLLCRLPRPPPSSIPRLQRCGPVSPHGLDSCPLQHVAHGPCGCRTLMCSCPRRSARCSPAGPCCPAVPPVGGALPQASLRARAMAPDLVARP